MDPVIARLLIELVPAAIEAIVAAIQAGRSKDEILLKIRHIAAEQAAISLNVDALAAGQ